jgi:hypothetical protein
MKTRKEIQKKYYEKNKSSLIRKTTEWRKRNSVYWKEYKRKWRAIPKNRDIENQRRRDWVKLNPDWYKNFYKEKRRICIEHYSKGKNCCDCCGENKIEFLSLDHINGGGGKHRKEIGSSNLPFWLIKNKFPDGFRILCHNCNQALGHYGYCPHKRITDLINTK